MKRGNNILIIGDGGRSDILSMFSETSESTHTDLYFIEHNKSDNLIVYNNYGEVLLWNQFENAYSLLNKYKINKVVFLHFGDYNEIATRVACKELKIPTYMLSHGLSFPNKLEAQNNVDLASMDTLKNKIKQNSLIKELLYLKNSFYKNTVTKSSKTSQVFLKLFFKTRSKNTMLDTFKKLDNDLLKLDTFICFNNSNKEWFIKKHKLDENYLNRIVTIGFPTFDNFTLSQTTETSEAKNVILIDQPFYEKSLFGWTLIHKKTFIDVLLKNGIILNIKPHPLGDHSFWDQYPTVNVLSNDVAFMKELSTKNVILGFNSTLLLPLAAMKNKAIFALEIHPERQEKPYFSDFLTESGVAKLINNYNELENELKNVAELTKSQNQHKDIFIRNWLYKFDGKSKERLTSILTSK